MIRRKGLLSLAGERRIIATIVPLEKHDRSPGKIGATVRVISWTYRKLEEEVITSMV